MSRVKTQKLKLKINNVKTENQQWTMNIVNKMSIKE